MERILNYKQKASTSTDSVRSQSILCQHKLFRGKVTVIISRVSTHSEVPRISCWMRLEISQRRRNLQQSKSCILGATSNKVEVVFFSNSIIIVHFNLIWNWNIFCGVFASVRKAGAKSDFTEISFQEYKYCKS